jgi:hypothetical protein
MRHTRAYLSQSVVLGGHRHWPAIKSPADMDELSALSEPLDATARNAMSFKIARANHAIGEGDDGVLVFWPDQHVYYLIETYDYFCIILRFIPYLTRNAEENPAASTQEKDRSGTEQ